MQIISHLACDEIISCSVRFAGTAPQLFILARISTRPGLSGEGGQEKVRAQKALGIGIGSSRRLKSVTWIRRDSWDPGVSGWTEGGVQSGGDQQLDFFETIIYRDQGGSWGCEGSPRGFAHWWRGTE